MSIRTQSGFILPTTLFLTLLLSSMLVGLSEQLLTQSYTFAARDRYHMQQLIEKSLLQMLIQELAAPDYFSSTHYSKQLALTSSVKAILSYSPTLSHKHEVAYAIHGLDGIIRGGVVYDQTTQTYTLK